VYDKFLELFVKETQAIKVGDPASPDTFQGPQVNKVQFDKILGYIKAGKEEGGRLLTGGTFGLGSRRAKDLFRGFS
jgi:aldehyde dehydrogenase (NAD+)